MSQVDITDARDTQWSRAIWPDAEPTLAGIGTPDDARKELDKLRTDLAEALKLLRDALPVMDEWSMWGHEARALLARIEGDEG